MSTSFEPFRDNFFALQNSSILEEKQNERKNIFCFSSSRVFSLRVDQIIFEGFVEQRFVDEFVHHDDEFIFEQRKIFLIFVHDENHVAKNARHRRPNVLNRNQTNSNEPVDLTRNEVQPMFLV